MNRWKSAAAGGIAALCLLAAAPVGALATNHGAHVSGTQSPNVKIGLFGRFGAVFGTLVTPGAAGGTATITTPDNGTQTIKLSAQVRFIARTQAALAAGYKAGDQVLALGRNSNGFTATTIQYDTAPFGVPIVRILTGTAKTSTDGKTVTLTMTGNKTATVHVGTATRFVKNGQRLTSLQTFTANESVRVLAQEQTDGTFVARLIVSGTGGLGVGGLGVGNLGAATSILTSLAGLTVVKGTIANPSAGANTFTVTGSDKTTVTIHTGIGTRYLVGGRVVSNPTLSKDEAVTVLGQKQSDNSVNAVVVLL